MKYEKIQPDCYYHIFNKGNNGENLFIEEMNYYHFLRLIQKYLVPVADILSYCLLKNHFHLVLKIKPIEEERLFSLAFSNLCNAYAKAINKRYSREGSLFRTRYKRVLVNDEDYLKQLIIYVNLNAIYHGFDSNIYNYKHSSLKKILSNRKSFVRSSKVLNLFENKENFKYYIQFKKLQFDEKMNALLLE